MRQLKEGLLSKKNIDKVQNDNALYLVWPYNLYDARMLCVKGFDHTVNGGNSYIFILTKEEVNKYVIGILDDVNYGLWIYNGKAGKAELIKKIRGFNGSDRLKEFGFKPVIKSYQS